MSDLSVTLVYRCSQTVVWIKVPLGMKVGLGPGHIVFNGTQLPPPPRKGHSSPPTFLPMSVVAKRLEVQDATW